MQAIQCSRGHFYDQSQGECPKCAEEARRRGGSFIDAPDYIPATAPSNIPGGAGATIPVNGGAGATVPVNGGAGATAPVNGRSSAPFTIPATMPAGGTMDRTIPVSQVGFTPTDFVTKPHQSGSWQVDDYSETQPNYITGEADFDPIVGWLVCVKGPNRGKDYRLHNGTNYIGSHRDNDVCIENDRTISREKAASISYDDKGQIFFIQRGEGRNLIYLNGRAVRSDADLKIYDHILIGSSELVFVPLCCDQFKWQDV